MSRRAGCPTLLLRKRKMTARNVRHYRTPNPPGMSSDSSLSLDLLDLAHASISEVGLTGGPVSPFVSTYEALLTGDSMLKWRGRGPGLGRELRRSYSNIYGRIFARSYLETNEGVRGLLPIEGNYCSFGQRAVVRLRDGESGDMPDWIGWDTNDFVIAEAKGTYRGGDWERSFWHGYATPQCLQKAQEQVARVQIDLYGYMLDVGFKGWSVASRWATEENGLDPWLAAIDPSHGGEKPDPDRFKRSAADMQRQALQRMIAAFGFSEGTSMIPRKESTTTIGSEFQPRRELWRRLVLSDEKEVRGLSAAYVAGNFVPIENFEQVVVLRQLLSDDSFLWLATLLEAPLLWAEKGEYFSEHEVERSSSFLSRNGMVVADLRQVQAVHAL